jgi:glycerol uptake facilitator-like aquaporin
MLSLLLILFGLFTYSLTLYIGQKYYKVSNDVDQSKARWTYDRILHSLLFGFMAAAFITSISMLMAHFCPVENNLLNRVAPIGIGLLLFVSGLFLIKKSKTGKFTLLKPNRALGKR